MDIIAKKTELSKAFWLYFYIRGMGDEWIEYGLPIPTIHKHANKGYFIGWAIDGYFGTKKGQDFLNDIIARFLISFKEQDIERLAFKPNKNILDSDTARIYAKVYKLREFSRQLKSLPIKKKYSPQRADMFEDFTFWAIKLYAEDQIRQYGQISYGIFESWALTQFESKERSTIKAKCRNIYQWYETRNWKLPEAKKHRKLKIYMEETMASRIENMKRIKKAEEDRNRIKVINVLTGLMSDEYKKKNGKWNITKIARDTNLTRPTVMKFVAEYEQNNL